MYIYNAYYIVYQYNIIKKIHNKFCILYNSCIKSRCRLS